MPTELFSHDLWYMKSRSVPYEDMDLECDKVCQLYIMKSRAVRYEDAKYTSSILKENVE